MTCIDEADNWLPGPSVLAPEARARMAGVLEEAPVIVEHWFYHGSRAPERLVFDDFNDLEAYLTAAAGPGDRLLFWRFDERCRTETAFVDGKVADDRGRVPLGGAY